MKTCPTCGSENAENARFCSQCATPLEAQAQPREERKVGATRDIRQAEALLAAAS